VIKVGPRTYRAFWTGCLVLALFLMLPMLLTVLVSVLDETSMSINFDGFAVIIASTAIGVILLVLSIFRLMRPLTPAARTSDKR